MARQVRNETLNTEIADQLETLACAHRILEMEGHGDLTLGHMSLRDPEGRGLWLKCPGLGLGEVRDINDFILIDFEGNQIAGAGGLHREWPIHTEIMRRRPDIEVVAHTHPFYTSLFSATRERLADIILDSSCFAGAVPHFEGTSGLVDTIEKGAALAEEMGSANAVLMVNHGVAFCGPSTTVATMNGVFLEKACKAQIVLNGSGLAWQESQDRKVGGTPLEKVLPMTTLESHWQYLKRRLPPI
jgi:L-fuculose-phosphate aldolase